MLHELSRLDGLRGSARCFVQLAGQSFGHTHYSWRSPTVFYIIAHRVTAAGVGRGHWLVSPRHQCRIFGQNHHGRAMISERSKTDRAKCDLETWELAPDIHNGQIMTGPRVGQRRSTAAALLDSLSHVHTHHSRDLLVQKRVSTRRRLIMSFVGPLPINEQRNRRLRNSRWPISLDLYQFTAAEWTEQFKSAVSGVESDSQQRQECYYKLLRTRSSLSPVYGVVSFRAHWSTVINRPGTISQNPVGVWQLCCMPRRPCPQLRR